MASTSRASRARSIGTAPRAPEWSSPSSRPPRAERPPRPHLQGQLARHAARGHPARGLSLLLLLPPRRDQAKWFIRNVPAEAGALPRCSTWNGTTSRPPATAPRPRDGAQRGRDFLRLLTRHYGQRPIIYTTPDFWGATRCGGSRVTSSGCARSRPIPRTATRASAGPSGSIPERGSRRVLGRGRPERLLRQPVAMGGLAGRAPQVIHKQGRPRAGPRTTFTGAGGLRSGGGAGGAGHQRKAANHCGESGSAAGTGTGAMASTARSSPRPGCSATPSPRFRGEGKAQRALKAGDRRKAGKGIGTRDRPVRGRDGQRRAQRRAIRPVDREAVVIDEKRASSCARTNRLSAVHRPSAVTFSVFVSDPASARRCRRHRRSTRHRRCPTRPRPR